MTCSDARNSHGCVYQKVPPPSGDVVDHSTQRIWELHLQRSDPVEGKDGVFFFGPYSPTLFTVFWCWASWLVGIKMLKRNF